MALEQSVNPGLLYVNGMGISYGSTSTVVIATGACRNSTNINTIVFNEAVTIDVGVSGANGVDTGTIQNSKIYGVYAIGASTHAEPAAGLLVLGLNSPVLPFNYDMYRRVGWIKTDGSGNVKDFIQVGEGDTRAYYYGAAVNVLTSGNATTMTAVSLENAAPPISTEVYFDLTYTAVSAANTAQLQPFAFSESTGIVRFGPGSAETMIEMDWVPCSMDGAVPKIKYKVTSGAGDFLTLAVAGFYDYLA